MTRLFVLDLKSPLFRKTLSIAGLRMVFCGEKVCRVFFGLKENPKKDPYLKKHFPGALFLPATKKHHAIASRMLKAFRKKQFFDDFSENFLLQGTAFQKSVWLQIAMVQFGQSSNYAVLSKNILKPKAMRAVGSACGKNPIPYFIPCHRIIAKNGGLGGFSGGLHLKKKLLAFETRA